MPLLPISPNLTFEIWAIDFIVLFPKQGKRTEARYIITTVEFMTKWAKAEPVHSCTKEVVAKFGPVAVAIDASSIWFQLYRKGVYYNKHCHNKPDQLDHAVLVVGYGTDPKKGDYWIVVSTIHSLSSLRCYKNLTYSTHTN